MSKKYITLCKSIYAPSDMIFVSLSEALESIKDEWFKDRIDNARGNKKRKENLPAFSFGGTFNGSVANKNLCKPSGLFHFDIDLPVSDIDSGNKVKHLVSSLPFVYSAWLSPNFGVKGLVKIANVKNDIDYKSAFTQINKLFQDVGIEIDMSCKDVRRFCFVCYDKNIYINKSSVEVNVVCTVPTLATVAVGGTVQNQDAIENRIRKILYNTKDGSFHATRYKVGVVIGGLIAGGQADDTLIDVFFEWSMLVHSTFGDNDNIIKKETKTFYDGLKVGKSQPIVDNFLYSKGK